MEENKGTHNEEIEQNEPDYFYINSLVEEITGKSLDDKGYDAAYTEILRLVKPFRKFNESNNANNKIPIENKDFFINIIKILINNPDKKKQLQKLNARKKLVPEDYEAIIEIWKEAEYIGKSEEYKKIYDKHIENEKQEDFYKVQEDIHDTINKQMKIIDKITNHTYKLFYSKNYLNLIKSSTEKIENDIKKANELGELINKTIPEMVIKELEKIERNKNNKDNISTKNNELNLKASDEIDFKKHSD